MVIIFTIITRYIALHLVVHCHKRGKKEIVFWSLFTQKKVSLCYNFSKFTIEICRSLITYIPGLVQGENSKVRGVWEGEDNRNAQYISLGVQVVHQLESDIRRRTSALNYLHSIGDLKK